MRIEIGGGPSPAHPTFEQFDAIDWSERTGLRYTLGDARKLPYADGSCEHVYASNLLEHFPPDETTMVLEEWARVLVPGGYLELVVPCVVGILRDYFTGTNPSWPECEERLLGSRDYPGNTHLNAFTLTDFPQVIAAIPSLRLAWCHPSHNGGGIHSLSTKEG